MKIVQKFKTRDGALFDTEWDAIKRDFLLDAIDKANCLLPGAVQQGCVFTNGGGYISHQPSDVARFKESAAAVFDMVHPGYGTLFLTNPNKLGRLLCDSNSPAYKLWVRCNCISGINCREYGQPYFVHHSDGCTPVEWAETEATGMFPKEKP